MVYNPPKNTNYAHIKLNKEKQEKIYDIMGKNGSWFKRFTEENGLKYVWYNKENKWIEIWGNHFSIEKSKDILIERINEIN